MRFGSKLEKEGVENMLNFTGIAKDVTETTALYPDFSKDPKLQHFESRNVNFRAEFFRRIRSARNIKIHYSKPRLQVLLP